MALLSRRDGGPGLEYTSHEQLQWFMASGAASPETHQVQRVRSLTDMPPDFRTRGHHFVTAMDAALGSWIDPESDVLFGPGSAPACFTWDDWMFDTPTSGWAKYDCYVVAVWVTPARVTAKRTGTLVLTRVGQGPGPWPPNWTVPSVLESTVDGSVVCDWSIAIGRHAEPRDWYTVVLGTSPDHPEDWGVRRTACVAGVRIDPATLHLSTTTPWWIGPLPGYSDNWFWADHWLMAADGLPIRSTIVPTPARVLRLRFGFELETQRTMGRLGNDYAPPSDSVVLDWVRRNHTSAMLDAFQEYLRDADPNAPVVPSQLDVVSVARRNMDQVPHVSTVANALNTPVADPPLSVKQDGTVSGVEIITVGGNTRAKVAAAIDRAFSVDHVIDTKCSFHIHVSGPERQPWWWGRSEFQWYACEYIAANLTQVPETCRARWRDVTWLSRYFPIKGGSGKYYFVAFRSATVEFRCWGNIQNAADAKAVMQLTRNAFVYAYRRCANDARATPLTTLRVSDFAALSNILTGAA